jgi:hypothetical protein
MHTRGVIDAPVAITADQSDGDICNATAAAADDDDDACNYDGAAVYCLLEILYDAKQQRCVE